MRSRYLHRRRLSNSIAHHGTKLTGRPIRAGIWRVPRTTISRGEVIGMTTAFVGEEVRGQWLPARPRPSKLSHARDANEGDAHREGCHDETPALNGCAPHRARAGVFVLDREVLRARGLTRTRSKAAQNLAELLIPHPLERRDAGRFSHNRPRVLLLFALSTRYRAHRGNVQSWRSRDCQQTPLRQAAVGP